MKKKVYGFPTSQAVIRLIVVLMLSIAQMAYGLLFNMS